MFRYAPIKKIERWGNIDLFSNIILKNYGRFYVDPETGKVMPVRVSLGQEGFGKEDGTDHPPTGIDPMTGEMIEGARHPMDALADAIDNLFRQNMEGQELSQENLNSVMNHIYSKHNTRIGAGTEGKHQNALKNHAHPEHRTNHHMGYIEDYNSAIHPHRTMMEGNQHGPRANYFNKKGDVKGGDEGEWLDAGFNPLSRQDIEEGLNDFNRLYENEGLKQPFAGFQTDSTIEYFLDNSAIPLHVLNPNIFTLTKFDIQDIEQNGGTLPKTLSHIKQKPFFITDHAIRETHPLTNTEFLPDELFRWDGKGRISTKDKEEIANEFRSQIPADHPYAKYSDEELVALAKVPAIKTAFNFRHDSGRKIDSTTKFRKKQIRQMLMQFGVPDNYYDRAMRDVLRHSETPSATKSSNKAAQERRAGFSALQHHLQEQGMNPEEAHNEAKNMIRGYQSQKLTPEEKETADMNRNFLRFMAQEQNILPAGPVRHTIRPSVMSQMPEANSQMPTTQEIDRRLPKDLEFIGQFEQQPPQPEVTARQETDAPPLPLSELERQEQREIKTASENTMQINTADSIRKQLEGTLEKMQYNRAKNNRELLKSLPSTNMDLNSINDVRVFSHQFGVTNMDVHGIMSSQGDWTKIAKQWNMPLQTVEAIKLAFGGI